MAKKKKKSSKKPTKATVTKRPKKAAPKKAAPKKAKKQRAAKSKAKPAPKPKPAPAAKPASRDFPERLAALHAVPFSYDDGIDFEPYEEFMSPDESKSWIQAWTGNKELTADEYRIFGQDGTGGYAMFWLVRPDADVLEQPIVFFGSEGELGVVARNFDDYAWLLAHGAGPLEVVSYGGETSKPHAGFTTFAEKHAPHAKKSPKEAIAAAKSEFPDFEARIRKLVKY